MTRHQFRVIAELAKLMRPMTHSVKTQTFSDLELEKEVSKHTQRLIDWVICFDTLTPEDWDAIYGDCVQRARGEIPDDRIGQVHGLGSILQDERSGH